jgi:hypothetical protein
MRTNSEYSREFKCLSADTNGLLSDLSRNRFPGRFLKKDSEKAVEIAKNIIDLARKEIDFINDTYVPDSPEPERLKNCITDLAELMQNNDDKFYFSQYLALLNEYLDDVATKVRRAARIRTPEERIELMKEAGILDEEGYYSPRFFSEETVAKDRARTKVGTS